VFKFQRHSKENEAQLTIKKDDLSKLTEYLKQCDLRKPLELELSPSSSLYEVVKVINGIILTQQNVAASCLLDTNGVVGQMTSMTSIREMRARFSSLSAVSIRERETR